MACEDIRKLMHGYLDGELDLASNLDLENHIQTCTLCGPEYQRQQALRSMLRNSDISFRAPAGLQKSIQSALKTAEGGPPAKRTRIQPAFWLSIAASIAVVALVAWNAGVRQQPQTNPETLIAENVVASHVRSLMVDHLTDVESTDNHTVKPWFSGKLEFAPPVKDLAAQGFPLAGGRLDYLNGPAAALVYKRRQHTINVFIQPVNSGSNVPAHSLVVRGYNLLHWTASGMNYWAVSDLNSAELNQLKELIEK
jgi:anti-sigma factor RsiW